MRIYVNRRSASARLFRCRRGFGLRRNRAIAGFTLLEILVVIVITAILLAIAAPGWTAFMNTQRLNTAQERVYWAMDQAQHRAKLSNTTWQASFREQETIVQWAIHPADTPASTAHWTNLDSSIRLDPETTLRQSKGVRKVEFNHKGHINGQLGRLTLSSKTNSKAKRCVITSTLLGVLRNGTDHTKKRDGKYCY